MSCVSIYVWNILMLPSTTWKCTYFLGSVYISFWCIVCGTELILYYIWWRGVCVLQPTISFMQCFSIRLYINVTCYSCVACFCGLQSVAFFYCVGLPLWSTGESSWLRFKGPGLYSQALLDFLNSSGVWNGVHSTSWG
jgi:hypothetical protein